MSKHFRSATITTFADEDSRKLIGGLTSFVGWSGCHTVEESIAGINEQARLITKFLNCTRASGTIVLVDEDTGEILHSAPFGKAARNTGAA